MAQVRSGSKKASVIVTSVSVTLPSFVTLRVKSTTSPTAAKGPSATLVKVSTGVRAGPVAVTPSVSLIAPPSAVTVALFTIWPASISACVTVRLPAQLLSVAPGAIGCKLQVSPSAGSLTTASLTVTNPSFVTSIT